MIGRCHDDSDGPVRVRAAAPAAVAGASNSLGFPKPAGPRPETRLAGYKRKGLLRVSAYILPVPGQRPRLAAGRGPARRVWLGRGPVCLGNPKAGASRHRDVRGALREETVEGRMRREKGSCT
jgi:hypothetical protein